MTILQWIKRRTLSRYADDKAVKDFERVARDKGLLPAKSAFDAAMEEERRADAEAWANLERDLKREG